MANGENKDVEMLFKWQGNVSLLLEPDLHSTSGTEADVIGNVKLISWYLDRFNSCILQFKQVHQGKESQFYQLSFVTTGMIIQYVLSGMTLDLFCIQYIFHQVWMPYLSTIK